MINQVERFTKIMQVSEYISIQSNSGRPLFIRYLFVIVTILVSWLIGPTPRRRSS